MALEIRLLMRFLKNSFSICFSISKNSQTTNFQILGLGMGWSDDINIYHLNTGILFHLFFLSFHSISFIVCCSMMTYDISSMNHTNASDTFQIRLSFVELDIAATIKKCKHMQKFKKTCILLNKCARCVSGEFYHYITCM